MCCIKEGQSSNRIYIYIYIYIYIFKLSVAEGLSYSLTTTIPLMQHTCI